MCCSHTCLCCRSHTNKWFPAASCALKRPVVKRDHAWGTSSKKQCLIEKCSSHSWPQLNLVHSRPVMARMGPHLVTWTSILCSIVRAATSHKSGIAQINRPNWPTCTCACVMRLSCAPHHAMMSTPRSTQPEETPAVWSQICPRATGSGIQLEALMQWMSPPKHGFGDGVGCWWEAPH
jgi:hypothetical protein